MADDAATPPPPPYAKQLPFTDISFHNINK